VYDVYTYVHLCVTLASMYASVCARACAYVCARVRVGVRICMCVLFLFWGGDIRGQDVSSDGHGPCLLCQNDSTESAT